MISGPKTDNDYAERHIDCQLALERDFQSLMRQAVAAGWTEQDVALALTDLALNSAKGLVSDRRDEWDIIDAMRTMTP